MANKRPPIDWELCRLPARSPEHHDARFFNALEKAELVRVVKGLPGGIDMLAGAGFGGQTDLSRGSGTHEEL